MENFDQFGTTVLQKVGALLNWMDHTIYPYSHRSWGRNNQLANNHRVFAKIFDEISVLSNNTIFSKYFL